MSTSIDPRTPLVVGGGQVNQRVDQGDPALEPVDLMVEAVRRAVADTGAADPGAVAAAADTVAAVNVISWRYRDPARLVAARTGSTPSRTWYTVASGSSPQSLVNRAARDIAAGDADLVVICGAEAWRTRMALRNAGGAHGDRRGTRPDWTTEPDEVEPGWTLGADDDWIVDPAEVARGLMMPVQFYPLFESAVRAAAGRSPAEHMVHISELWSRFSEVAAANPNAWIQRRYSPEEIRDVGPGNRMVGAPYPKLMNSNSAVEQGAAVIVCSAETARAFNMPVDRWVFPWSGTDAHDTMSVSNRTTLAGSPAIRTAGRAALELAGVGVDDLAHIDLYSCFPSAVEVGAAELGLSIDRQLTITGGLSFAGGPWNNYVSHSIATMVHRLREEPGVGLITGNGGFLTKHAMGVYGSTPPASGAFRWTSTQDEVDAVGTVDVCGSWDGPATVEAVTVMHSRDGEPEQGFAALRVADGRRAWGTTTDPDTMKAMVTDETVGRAAQLTPDGAFQLA